MHESAVHSSDQPRATAPIVSLRRIAKAFGSLHVLRDVSLDFHPGHCTVVLGPSGTGKSVMLKIMVRLLKPDAGEVHFDDRRIDNLSEGVLGDIRMQFGFLFQMGALFDSMTVMENICFPLDEHTTMSPSQKLQRGREILGMVGLADAGEKMPAELSGGQRKRIALARAIALKPRVILYDEPTTGLDPITADGIDRLIIKLQRELNVASIVVTHDLQSAFKIADRLVMLYDGYVIEDGTPDKFRCSSHPMVRRFIEGKADELDAEASADTTGGNDDRTGSTAGAAPSGGKT